MALTVVKSEWHQLERRYTYPIDEEVLSEIYPEMEKEEISLLMLELLTGTKEVSEVIDDAYEEGVEMEWNWDYDDCWTDRKGGYEVTYAIEDEE